MIMMKTQLSIFDRSVSPKPEFCYEPRTNIYTNSLTSHVKSSHATYFQCMWEVTSDAGDFVQVFFCICVVLELLLQIGRIIVADWTTTHKKRDFGGIMCRPAHSMYGVGQLLIDKPKPRHTGCFG